MKPAKPAKTPESKVRNKVVRLAAIADRLALGESTASVAEELAQVANLLMRLSATWGGVEDE